MRKRERRRGSTQGGRVNRVRNKRGVSAAFRDNFTHKQTNRTVYINKIVCINVGYKVPKWLFANKCNVPEKKSDQATRQEREKLAKTDSMYVFSYRRTTQTGRQQEWNKKNTYENKQESITVAKEEGENNTPLRKRDKQRCIKARIYTHTFIMLENSHIYV